MLAWSDYRYLLTSLSIIFNTTDECIPAVLFSYRASQNDTTGYSPFYLETGRFPTLPVAALLNRVDEPEEESQEEWVKQIVTRLDAAFSYAKRAQREVAERNLERQARRHVDVRFEKEDMLYLLMDSQDAVL